MPPQNSNANPDLIAAVQSIAQAVKVSSLGVQEGWHAVTFQNSWVNYGGTFGPASYMKDTMGFVHLRGVIKNGSVGGFPVFNLPVGYRPAYDTSFAVHSNSAFGVVQVLGQISPGDVRVLIGNNAFVYLDGVSFLAEA